MSRVVYDQTSMPQFRPDGHHCSVQAVLNDKKLSADEKRAILSAWASDMYAVESSPALRMIPGHTTPLRLSEILDALRGLDDDDPPPRGGVAKRMSVSDPGADPIHGSVSLVAHRLAHLRQDASVRAAKIRAHRDNVQRYKRILATGLTELERKFVHRRLAEEQSAIYKLIG
ncbi:hypothetical protein ACWX0K_24160 (plasmid) [Nitrobacteraceae bacterium UC4446_H13]